LLARQALLERRALQVAGAARTTAPVSWRDHAGSHFLLRVATGVDVIEYIVPEDPYRDASERVFDASTGSSIVDCCRVGTTKSGDLAYVNNEV